jgi:hypothetical protein
MISTLIIPVIESTVPRSYGDTEEIKKPLSA